MEKRTHVLVILDGWGERDAAPDNAITSAHTPCFQRLLTQYPHTTLAASGEAVGLPAGQIGNSEVGHLHLGAGRLVRQDLSAINEAIHTGDFFKNAALQKAFSLAKKERSRIHVLGLLSPGGVHSHEAHFHALLDMAKQQSQALCIHAFLDGRDCPPRSALGSLQQLETHCDGTASRIASISGRYYAMDRDNRWARIEKAYRALTVPISEKAHSAVAALQSAYASDVTDEFVLPTQILRADGEADLIEDNDVVIFMNFRPDRARQLTRVFLSKSWPHFSREKWPHLAYFVSLTPYAKDLETAVAFPKSILTQTLGEVISEQGLPQLRLAETEKYAHVTFFFNGGREEVFSGEERILIPSPSVATYDLKPEMSAKAITQKLVAAIESRQYALIVCNYANADMVGHTGDFRAACRAIEAIDVSLAAIEEAVLKTQACALITADHGNAECMFDEQTQQPHTAHTNLAVPLIYVDAKPRGKFARTGSLQDVAPTLLALMAIAKPQEMTGQNLLSC